MSKNVVIIGTGQVGQALAKGFVKNGFEVTLASREGKLVDGWTGKVGKSSEVVSSADIVVVAVKGTAAEGVVKSIADQIKGKTIIDVTNPIADEPPQNGVLKYFTSLDESLCERLQKIAPEAHFVKAFNSVGNAYFVDPDFGGIKPTMFICGNNMEAKKEVRTIVEIFGWEAADMGGIEAARAIEPLCMLWCIPGMLHNEWTHAFKLLKK